MIGVRLADQAPFTGGACVRARDLLRECDDGCAKREDREQGQDTDASA